MTESRGGATWLSVVGGIVVVIVIVLGLVVFLGKGAPPRLPSRTALLTPPRSAPESTTTALMARLLLSLWSAGIACAGKSSPRSGAIISNPMISRTRAGSSPGCDFSARQLSAVRPAGHDPRVLVREGDYPDSLVSTIYGFDGKVRVAGIPTRARRDWSVWHLFHAHAHWEPLKQQRATIDLRSAELRADTPDSARRRAIYARALLEVIAAGQGSCKGGGCCYPRRIALDSTSDSLSVPAMVPGVLPRGPSGSRLAAEPTGPEPAHRGLP